MKHWYNKERSVVKTFIQNYRSTLFQRGDFNTRLKMDVNNCLQLYVATVEDRVETNMIKVIKGVLTQLQGSTVCLKILLNSSIKVNSATKIQQFYRTQIQTWMKITIKLINKIIFKMKTEDVAIYLTSLNSSEHQYLKYLNFLQQQITLIIEIDLFNLAYNFTLPNNSDHIAKIAKKYIQNRRENQKITLIMYKAKMDELKAEQEKLEQQRDNSQGSEPRRIRQQNQSSQVSTPKRMDSIFLSNGTILKGETSPQSIIKRMDSQFGNTLKRMDSQLKLSIGRMDSLSINTPKRVEQVIQENKNQFNRQKTKTNSDLIMNQDLTPTRIRKNSSKNFTSFFQQYDKNNHQILRQQSSQNQNSQSTVKSESRENSPLCSPLQDKSKFGQSNSFFRINNGDPIKSHQHPGKKFTFFVKIRQVTSNQQVSLSMKQMREIPENIKSYVISAMQKKNFEDKQFIPSLNLMEGEEMLKNLIIDQLKLILNQLKDFQI